MPNHVMHFWKSDDFWKVGQCSTFLINHMWFFFKYNKTGVFNQSEIGNEHASTFQKRMCSKFQKI